MAQFTYDLLRDSAEGEHGDGAETRRTEGVHTESGLARRTPACRKDRREQDCINITGGKCRTYRVNRSGQNPVGASTRQGIGSAEASLRQVHAVRLDRIGQVDIQGDQQRHAPIVRHGAQSARLFQSLWSAETAMDDARARRHAGGDLPGARRSFWIGQEQKGRDTRRFAPPDSPPRAG